MFSTTMLWKSSYPMLNAHDQSHADINADMQALCNMGILAIPLMLQSQSYLKSPLTPLEVPSGAIEPLYKLDNVQLCETQI